LPDLLRRVAALTAMSVVGIALLAPLTARSARPEAAAEVAPLLAGLPDGAVSTLARSALVDRVGANGATLAPTGPGSAESVDSRLDDRPATVPMQATLVTIPTPPPAPTPVFSSGDTVWDTLAMCEASGNWAANTGNGYYGGLQFSVGTWSGYGGAEFAAYPHQATREQQIIVAERLRAARGYQPWPACRAKLGLP
jgi:Transglycosylase-like domain